MTPPVLIIGAGPAGLTMALELKRFGIDVRIVEQTARRTDKSKALVLWSRTLELLERSGGTAEFVAAGFKVTAANIIAGGHLIGHVGFSDVRSPFPFALMLPQCDTERLLETQLNRLGVNVERSVEAIGFTQTADSVTTTLRHADAREETVVTPWLIGCDGAHSRVRHVLGMEFTGQTLLSDWILADVRITGLKFPESEMAMFWHEDGVLAIFPISPGRYRVIADLGHSEAWNPADPTLGQIRAVVERRGPAGLLVEGPVWMSGFRINERKVASYRSGRVFLAGDAAHVHSPAGGQGMNTGMQDAFNLAWKLALVCRGLCRPEKILDSFSAERSAVGDRLLAATGRLTALAMVKNHAAQTVRNFLGGVLLGLAPLRRAMANQFSEVSVGYTHSPFNGQGVPGQGGPAPGERAPVAAGTEPVGAGDIPRFALFATPTDETLALLREHQDILESALRPPLGSGVGSWLVRPDGYTACVAKFGDIRPIADYLKALK